ncbi:MAG TPA: FAD-binding protein [Tissierellia bacterium]|nr:FAD-binding protein [Tissierellia bacterium]
MDYCWSYNSAFPHDPTRLTHLADKNYPGVIWVDINGQRMIDEFTDDLKSINDTYLNADENIVYFIISEEMLTDDNPILNVAYGPKDENNKLFFEELEKGNLVFEGNTPEELAENAGINPEQLRKTIDTYNTYVDNGEDADFGRTKELKKLEGKLYAVKTIPYAIMTYGGIKHNVDAEVLDVNNEPISGLYVAGEAVGNVQLSGENTCAGSGLGQATLFGRVAGKNAAKNALE